MDSNDNKKSYFEGLNAGNATKRTVLDVGYQIVRAGIDAATDAAVTGQPDFGGAVAEVLDLAVTPILHRRFEHFISGLLDGCKKLEIDVKDLEAKIAEDGQFVTVLVEAARSATATHHEEKRKALRNAVLNTYLEPGDADQELYFLTLIDQLVPAEMRILANLWDVKAFISEFYDGNNLINPAEITRRIALSCGQNRQFTFTEMYIYLTRAIMTGAEAEAFHSYLQHLISLGLINNLNESEYDLRMGNLVMSGTLPHLVTNLGHNFLNYISSPIEENEGVDDHTSG